MNYEKVSIDPGIKIPFSDSFMVMPQDNMQVDLHQWKWIVSRVIQKEKVGKGIKEKEKGKDNRWNTTWAFGRCHGNSKGRGKGKGKGKKGGGRGKGKSNGKKGGKFKGGKPKVAENQCTLCYEFGHWSRECPNRMVNQVEGNCNYNRSRMQNSPYPPQQPQDSAPVQMSQPPQSSSSQSST